ncbi:MAG: FKBP-type peptidyl-prolyl cis-trans isomerase, partial [Gammaproteobacteria bacterium]
PAASPDDGPTLYTLGQLISRTLERFTLTPEELAMVQQGIEDGVLGRPPKVDLAAEAPKLHALQAARSEALAARGRQAGAAVLAGAASAPGTVRLPTGVLLQPLQPGDGPAPTATDHVRVHYEGTLPDGTVFDSSRARGEPATFPVRGVIACWTEALQAMRVGGRSRVVCPPELAYGERGAPPAIKPHATLVFDIELLAIVR